MANQALYQAILARRAVRRYQKQLLDKATLTKIEEIISDVKPLVPANRFRVLMRDVLSGEDLIAAMGGYGRVVSPPHYLIPYAIGDTHLLTDLGYRMEQIAVHLTNMGIGTCFIGSLGREKNVRVRFRINRDARIGAFLLLGRPAISFSGKAFNAMLRRASGATQKLASEHIFFKQTFDAPEAPPPKFSKLIEAARHAPSAYNAQPWRWLYHEQQLYLFVQRRHSRYGKGITQEYRFFDGGTAMANITMAMLASEIEGNWLLLDEASSKIPEHPDELQPIAKLILQ